MLYNPKADMIFLFNKLEELDRRVSKLEKVIPILMEAQELIYGYMKGDENERKQDLQLPKLQSDFSATKK